MSNKFYLEMPGDEHLNIGVYATEFDGGYPVFEGVTQSGGVLRGLVVIATTHPQVRKWNTGRTLHRFIEVDGPERNLTRAEYISLLWSLRADAKVAEWWSWMKKWHPATMQELEAMTSGGILR